MSLRWTLNRLALVHAAIGLAVVSAVLIAGPAHAQRKEINLSGSGWSLWLDAKAQWEQDTLYLPPVNLKSLPTNPPTIGWGAMYAQAATAVSTPGTVEEYTWDKVAATQPDKKNLLRGDYKGVSWWWKEFTLPVSAKGKRLILHFESVRLRAEVFLNDKLVGYDVIGNTPFDIDITGKAKTGGKNRLAVRVTDPGGNFTWFDPEADSWGKYKIPASHGFGGITGPVSLAIVDPVYVSDIYIKNKPEVTKVDVAVTVDNTAGVQRSGDLRIDIRESGKPGRVIHSQTVRNVKLSPGQTVVSRSISVPKAKIWDLQHPNLYTCTATLQVGGQVKDTAQDRFGFRWFGVDGVGKNAIFRLNGKRIFICSAINWGFWPINGVFPTKELARKEVESAKSLGLNMINFHRCIGMKVCFDAADEMGLLRFEEPGGYASHNGNDFTFAWAREKLLRMVKRDRNHPSLVIYNMINEEGTPPVQRNKKDMADAHKIDPSRTILYTSGWARSGVDDPIKLHMLPNDPNQYIRGWFDEHHALGPGVYQDAFYKNPTEYYLYTKNRGEIVFWGEEGAIATPPRLEKIDAYLKKTGKNGWDGTAYEAWYDAYVKYLDGKNLRKYFPTVDDLTRSMGNISFYYQGRMIENTRIGDATDGYVVNGWEAELMENHSGIVDCFRNPKGDPGVLAKYNRPLYVAVKVRNKVVQVPATVEADLYVVNEVNLKGNYTLKVALQDPNGNQVWQQSRPVKVSGGDVYGELLQEGVKIDVPKLAGYYTVKASLVGSDGKVKTQGEDQVFAVDWKSATLSPNGSILELGNKLGGFLKNQKGIALPRYAEELGKLDYVLIGDADPESNTPIPADALSTNDGKPGLLGEYFSGTDLKTSVAKRVDSKVDFDWSGTNPAPSVPQTFFSVRWTGKVTAPDTGSYVFRTMSDDGVRLWVNGQLVIDNWTDHASKLDSSPRIPLEAGKSYDIKLEFFQGTGGSVIKLLWSNPSMVIASESLVEGILDRVKNDGTTAVFATGVERWARYLKELGIIKYNGRMNVDDVWVGGNLFVREHPLFKGLPINQGFNWEYQAFENYGVERYGLMLEDEEAVVGTVNSNEPRVGTAVSVVNYGKGKIVLSTLDMRTLDTKSPGADVVNKVLCNYIEFAGSGH